VVGGLGWTEIAYLAALGAFLVLAFFAHARPYFAWDLTLARGLQSFAPPGMYALMRAVSVFADAWVPFVLTPVTGLAFVAAGRVREGAGLLLTVAANGLLNHLVKLIVQRPRPPPYLLSVYRDLRSHSFPSGHVSFYVCYFGFLCFLASTLMPPRTLKRQLALALSATPIALVGLSRVYLGEHWPSDVTGGYLLSGTWLAISLRLYRRWSTAPR
jgi:undecaprenyl-diphosphatase